VDRPLGLTDRGLNILRERDTGSQVGLLAFGEGQLLSDLELKMRRNRKAVGDIRVRLVPDPDYADLAGYSLPV